MKLVDDTLNTVADVIWPLPAGQVSLKGRLGDAVRRSIANRLKKVDYAHLVEPFRLRNETDGYWRCEFWGKIVRSAIRSWRGEPDPELLKRIQETVADIISTQTADGCISSYPAELQTQEWDIWGRKYVLIGLALYYRDIAPEERVKSAMIRMLDHLMTQVGPDARNIVACGNHTGLAASSILEPVVLAYRITGERRFLDYALWIAAQGGSSTGDIFASVLRGVPPKELGNGKAYEMMSCFEGLAELYRETGNPDYREAILVFYRAVRDQEIFVTGTGGLKDHWGEFWDGGKARQTHPEVEVEGLGETCVTTTWIKFCSHVLRLTGDATVADEMERTLYNAVLGAMVPDGSWWMHRNPTPLAGPASKVRAGDQIPGYGEDCCVAQGPMGLAMAPWFAIMRDGDGPVINLYEAAEATVELANGSPVKIAIGGDFPRSGEVNVTVMPAASAEFPIRLRLPGWSRQTHVSIDGKMHSGTPGSYLVIERRWSPGDLVQLQFDMSVRAIPAPDGGDHVALMRGPVVLAQDSRLGTVDAPLSVDALALSSAVAAVPPPSILDAYRFADGMTLCDCASAGNEFSEGNRLCVWMKDARKPKGMTGKS